MKPIVGALAALGVLVGSSPPAKAQSQESEKAIQSETRDVRDRLQREKSRLQRITSVGQAARPRQQHFRKRPRHPSVEAQ